MDGEPDIHPQGSRDKETKRINHSEERVRFLNCVQTNRHNRYEGCGNCVLLRH